MSVSEAKERARQLAQLHKDFFSASSPAKKQEIRQCITTLEWELIEATLTERNQMDSLAKLDEVRKGKEKPFFLWKLNFSEVFKQKGGFDVVIGNPPYVQIQNFSGQQIQKDWEAQKYATFAKTGDIYCLFYEKGHRLLRDGGALCFITSNKWMRAGYGQKIREFLLKQASVRQLIDFGDSPIFSEATTYTNVLLFEKATKQKAAQAWDLSRAYRSAVSLERMLAENPAGTALFTDDAFAIASPELAAIKKQIKAIGTPLKEWDVAINYGIKTGFNEAFIIDGKKKDELIALDPKGAEIIKPILRGRDIKRYRVDFSDLWLLFVPWHFPLNDDSSVKGSSAKAEELFKVIYPAIYDYVSKFKESLSIRNKAETGIRYEWYALQRCAATYHEKFNNVKIVYPETSSSNLFALDTQGHFMDKTSFMIDPGSKYLLALLNSEVACYFFNSIVSKMRGGYFSLSKIYVEQFPAPKIPNTEQIVYEIIVDYALSLAKNDCKLQSAYFEQLIDGLVYELYFPDEIKAAGKELLPYIGELAPINDAQTSEEKLAVIQHEFDRLYDPRHPVRNRLETLDSVEVVRIIREALKK